MALIGFRFYSTTIMARLCVPDEARENLGLGLDMEDEKIISHDYPKKYGNTSDRPWARQEDGSRHPGTKRLLISCVLLLLLQHS